MRMVQMAVYGNFSAHKAQEIIISRGSVLELLRPDDAGHLQTVLTTNVFGELEACWCWAGSPGQDLMASCVCCRCHQIYCRLQAARRQDPGLPHYRL